MVRDEGRQTGVEVTQVQELDIGKILHRNGANSRIRIADDEQEGASPFSVHHAAKRCVAAHEIGVFILLVQNDASYRPADSPRRQDLS